MGNSEEFKLVYKIQGDASGMRSANAEMQKFDKGLSGIGSTLAGKLSGLASGGPFESLTSQIGATSGALSSMLGPAGLAVTAVAGIATAAIGATAGLFALAKGAAEYGNVIASAQTKTGLGVETLDALRYAAELSGKGLDDLTAPLGKFAKLLAEAAQGSEEARDKLVRLGIDPQEAIKDYDKALEQVFNRINSLQNPIAKTKALIDLFGKGGVEMAGVIKKTGGNFEAFKKQAEALGLVMSEKDVKASAEFTKEMRKLEAQSAALKFQFAKELMPAFIDGMESISQWMSRNKGEIASWGQATADVLTGLGAAWQKTKEEAIEAWPYLSGAVGQTNVGQETLLWTLFAIPMAASKAIEALRHLGEEERAAHGKPSWVPGQAMTIDPKTYTLMGVPGPEAKKPKPEMDAEFFANLKAQKDAAEKARKERLERAKRDNAAMITVEQMYIKDIEAVYADTIAFAEKKLGEGGRITDYKKEVVDANEFLKKTTKESYEKIAALENIAAERDNKTATEKETLRQQQADRLSDIEVKTGKARIDSQEKADKELQKRQNDGYQEATANIAAFYDLQQANLDLAHETALTSELEYQTARNKLILDEMQKELDAMVLAGKPIAEIELQKLKIQAAKVRAQQSERAAEKKDAADRQKEHEQDIEDFYKLAEAIHAASKARDELNAQDRANRTVGSSSAIGALDQLRDHFVGDQNTAAIAGVDALATAFDGLGQAIGQVVEAWVLYGNAGGSVRQITAQILAGIAQQAAVKAIFELAEGFAALAMSFFGVPNAGPSATAHFAAAAIYGSIAGVAALAGRAVAGDSMKQGGTSSASSGNSNASQGGQNAPPRTYSRASDGAYMSGNRSEAQLVAAAVDKLNARLDSMRPGDVLTVGIRQKPGAIGKASSDDAGTHPQFNKLQLKRGGIR